MRWIFEIKYFFTYAHALTKDRTMSQSGPHRIGTAIQPQNKDMSMLVRKSFSLEDMAISTQEPLIGSEFLMENSSAFTLPTQFYTQDYTRLCCKG